MIKNIAITVVLALALAGCRESAKVETPTAPPSTSPYSENELIVIENALLTQAAIEAWAAEGDGLYPVALTNKTPVGNTVYDFLPNGELLVNPYTGGLSEPGLYLPRNVGEVGYESLSGPTLKPEGYMIEGLGDDHRTVIFLQK